MRGFLIQALSVSDGISHARRERRDSCVCLEEVCSVSGAGLLQG